MVVRRQGGGKEEGRRWDRDVKELKRRWEGDGKKIAQS